MVFSCGMLCPHKLVVPPAVVMSVLPVLKGLRGAGRAGTSCDLVNSSRLASRCCCVVSAAALTRNRFKLRLGADVKGLKFCTASVRVG